MAGQGQYIAGEDPGAVVIVGALQIEQIDAVKLGDTVERFATLHRMRACGHVKCCGWRRVRGQRQPLPGKDEMGVADVIERRQLVYAHAVLLRDEPQSLAGLHDMRALGAALRMRGERPDHDRHQYEYENSYRAHDGSAPSSVRRYSHDTASFAAGETRYYELKWADFACRIRALR